MSSYLDSLEQTGITNMGFDSDLWHGTAAAKVSTNRCADTIAGTKGCAHWARQTEKDFIF